MASRDAGGADEAAAVVVRRARIAEVLSFTEASEVGDAELPANGIYWLAFRGGAPVGYAVGRLEPHGCTPVCQTARPGPGRASTLTALRRTMAEWAELAGIPLDEAT